MFLLINSLYRQLSMIYRILLCVDRSWHSILKIDDTLHNTNREKSKALNFRRFVRLSITKVIPNNQ